MRERQVCGQFSVVRRRGALEAEQVQVAVPEKRGSNAIADLHAGLGMPHQPRPFLEIDQHQRVGHQRPEGSDGARLTSVTAYTVPRPLASIHCNRVLPHWEQA